MADSSVGEKRKDRIEGVSDGATDALATQRIKLEPASVPIPRTGANADGFNDETDWSDDDDAEGLAALMSLKDTIKKEKEEAVQQASVVEAALSANAPSSTALVLVDEEAQAALQTKKKIAKVHRKQEAVVKQLRHVDHSKVDYAAFKKDFYVPPPTDKELSAAELRTVYKELDGAKLEGKDLPVPMKSWDGIGLSDRCFEYLRTANFTTPYAVQSLAIPPLMSGRDLLITAKTGSGKTLAYMLPLVRHVENQPRCANGEGPIGLVVVPTHELAQQIYRVAAPLCKASGLKLIPAFGGTNLGDNIAAVKRGCDVMIATPHRLHDLLLTNNESAMNLRKTTFFVCDEADRMFDEGFRPFVLLFLRNIRPDRQVAFISATMPPDVRDMAKEQLQNPIILKVGGRPSPSSNVTQTVEFFDEMQFNSDRATTELDDPRFKRLLEIVGDEIEEPNNSRVILIFVQRNADCSRVSSALKQMGWQGKVGDLNSELDSKDREMAMRLFAPDRKPILFASGLAERGLDVTDLDLVINYYMPDHYEAYIQRIGRTGRAGKRGRAISFFTRKKDDALANDLALGLEDSGNEVPEELNQLALAYRASHKNSGKMNLKRGYGNAKSYQGKESKEERKQRRKIMRDKGLGDYMSSSGSDDDDVDSDADVAEKRCDPPIFRSDENSRELALYTNNSSALTLTTNQENRVQDALNFAKKVTDAENDPDQQDRYTHETQLEINDYPEKVRLQLQKRYYHQELEDKIGAKIALKGKFFDPKKRFKVPDGERKLYLEIRGKSRDHVTKVLRELEEKRRDVEARLASRGSAFGVRL